MIRAGDRACRALASWGWALHLALFVAGCGESFALVDGDGDGYTLADGDCRDDTFGSDIHPGAGEIWYDGVDQDCDGRSDFDKDGDGYGSATHDEEGEDCFDAADDPFDNSGGLPPADVHPGASDEWYDGTDADCGGDDDYDQDGDGYPLDEECDDTDADRYPNPDIVEVWYDGVDANCDGHDGDQDGDGWYIADYGFEVPAAYQAGDCWDDPGDAGDWEPLGGFSALGPGDVHPGATETWYEGLDQDCGADGDFDQDGDGQATRDWPDAAGGLGADCDDTRADVYAGAPDTWYDGLDADCAGNDVTTRTRIATASPTRA